MSDTPITDALANEPTPANGDFSQFRISQYSGQCKMFEREITRLTAELAALKSQPQEPVAIVRNGNVHWIVDNWPDNTNLYAASEDRRNV